MPIQKFKTFEQAEKALWNFSPDKKYFDSIKSLFTLKAKMKQVPIKPGVHKFKNLAEANRHRTHLF